MKGGKQKTDTRRGKEWEVREKRKKKQGNGGR